VHASNHQVTPRSLLSEQTLHTREGLHRLTATSAPHNCIVRREYSSPGRTGSTSTLPCAATTRHSATGSTSTLSCAVTTRLRLHALYLSTAMRRDYSSPGHTGSTSTSPCVASTHLPAAAALHRLRRTPPRRRLLGVQLLRLLISTSKLVENGFRAINN
jgi:hypothetical protein